MGTPWEELITNIYRVLTKGRRRVFTLPLVVFLILLPWVTGIVESYSKLTSIVPRLLAPPEKSIPSAEEFDVFNEWVILIGRLHSEKRAREFKVEVEGELREIGGETSVDNPFDTRFLFCVRDPKNRDVWLLIIDPCKGESSQEEVTKKYFELNSHAIARRREKPKLLRYLLNSGVLYYSKNEFIETYGQIIEE